MKNILKKSGYLLALIAVAGLSLQSLTPVQSSSHREAPYLTGDAKVDATDLYAFVSPDKNDTVSLIANYLPFQEPAGGPNFYSLDDTARYEIHIDNNGDAKEDITYRFEFDTTYENPNTFLYNTGTITSLNDTTWNAKQTYTLTKIHNNTEEVLLKDVATPPSNIGPKSTPNYAALRAQAVYTAGNTKVFAGQSEDPFFVDLGATFDLLNIRKLPGDSGAGIDTVKGFNVHSLALQIPTDELTNDDDVIGVWTTASRQTNRVIPTDLSNGATSGPWVQVSRLGNPLVNEVVIPLKDKNKFNNSKPADDAQFANYVANPELATLFNSIFGIKVPPQGPFGTAEARDDLVTIFLTGVEGLNQPKNVVPSEQMRLNTAIMPTDTAQRLGVLAGDTAGHPNGRRLTDDVVDIALQAVAGAAYPLFHPEYMPDPLASKLGDGVNSNDKQFGTTFPYVGLPFQGFESVPHANSTTGAGDNNDNASLVQELKNTIVSLQAEVGSLKQKIVDLMKMLGGNNNGNNGNNGDNGNNGNNGDNAKYKETFTAPINQDGLTGTATFKVRGNEQSIDYAFVTNNNVPITSASLTCSTVNSSNSNLVIPELITTENSDSKIKRSDVIENFNCSPGIKTLSHLVQAIREGKIMLNIATAANSNIAPIILTR